MRRPAMLILSFSLMTGLAACAVTHGEIAPAPIPPEAYAPASCRQLALMRAKTMRSLTLASIIQDQHYADDRTRTFGVPTPMATIFDEDRAPEVARLKGESLALTAQLENAGCVERK